MTVKNCEIDKIDLQILSILLQDAKIPYTKIGEMLYVSPGTVHVRMKKLVESGIIKKHQISIDHTLLGYDITAFIGIFLKENSLYDTVVEGLRHIQEVVEVNYTTGGYSMFVKLICRDTNHLKAVLHDKLQTIKGIQRTETFISLEQSINRPLLLSDEKIELH